MGSRVSVRHGERAAARFLISGRVQGVGFRWFVARRASELGVTGWARNLPSGQVEVVAAGDAGAIGQMEASLRAGPTLARVESVEKSEIPHQIVEPKSFEIR
jgi:acylphosphatase